MPEHPTSNTSSEKTDPAKPRLSLRLKKPDEDQAASSSSSANNFKKTIRFNRPRSAEKTPEEESPPPPPPPPVQLASIETSIEPDQSEPPIPYFEGDEGTEDSLKSGLPPNIKLFDAAMAKKRAAQQNWQELVDPPLDGPIEQIDDRLATIPFKVPSAPPPLAPSTPKDAQSGSPGKGQGISSLRKSLAMAKNPTVSKGAPDESVTPSGETVSESKPESITTPIRNQKRRRSKWLLIALLLLVGAVYFAYQNFHINQIIAEERSSTAPTGPADVTNTIAVTTQPGDLISEIPQAGAVAPVSEITSPSAPPEPPPEPVISRPPADPVIAAFIDNLIINLIRDSGDHQRLVIDNVVYPVGSVIEPTMQVRFIGFERARKEMIFEDARGSRYYRYY